MSNENRKPPSTDIFHLSLLFTLVAIAWMLNWAFGFKSGTTPFGSIFSVSVAVWAFVAIYDYFKR